MALLAEHLVGRVDELGSLERILDELDQGRPGAIEVAGEPGIGKTRLLRELTARAGARGHLVLSGAASELEHDLPFSVFVAVGDRVNLHRKADCQKALTPDGAYGGVDQEGPGILPRISSCPSSWSEQAG
jgi:predicted ATPase